MSNEHEALKPCPFCGGEAMIGGGGDHNVMCLLCPASVVGDTEAEAIAAWNTRATPSPSTDTLDAKAVAASVVQSVCETEPANPDHPDTVIIEVTDLETIVRVAIENALDALGGRS